MVGRGKLYFHGRSDEGARSQTHVLNEEFGRSTDRDCMLCDGEYKSTVHMLWEHIPHVGPGRCCICGINTVEKMLCAW